MKTSLSIIMVLIALIAFAQDPEPIVSLPIIQEVPEDYVPPIDPNAQYKVTLNATFNDVDGVLAQWLHKKSQELALTENCVLTFEAHRVSEKEVAAEQIGEIRQQIDIERAKIRNERHKLQNEREKLILLDELAKLEKQKAAIMAGNEPEEPIARSSLSEDDYLQRPAYDGPGHSRRAMFIECLNNYTYEECEHLE